MYFYLLNLLKTSTLKTSISQRGKTKSKQRKEVTTYNQVKNRPKLTQNHADPSEPEGNPPT